MIYRPDYINSIAKFIDLPLVKILAGIRRCGKSTIMEMIKAELMRRNIPAERIIMRNYSGTDIDKNFTAKTMYQELKNLMSGNGKYYILLDELQEIDGWEKAVNQLMEQGNADIYATGSNSKLMSGEISTYLSGRYVSIPVYSLSFKEFISFDESASGKEKYAAGNQTLLEKYIRLGGFPVVAAHSLDDRTAYQVVHDIYNAIVNRDIVRRHRISRQDLFARTVKFIIDNMGKPFSANSIAKFLKSENRKISVETIYNYLKWLQDAFIIYKCQRYDIMGKAVLKTQEKYYLADHSLKYALMGYNGTMLPAVIENIVFMELLRRGYEVFIGKNKDKEIDFIAQRQDEKIYVQACVSIPQDSNREKANLLDIYDNYPKYIITLDPLYAGNADGIQIISLSDFLLGDF